MNELYLVSECWAWYKLIVETDWTFQIQNKSENRNTMSVKTILKFTIILKTGKVHNKNLRSALFTNLIWLSSKKNWYWEYSRIYNYLVKKW